MPEHGKALAGIQDSQPYNQNYLRKTHKTPLVILEILQPLQVIPEISSSSSWHLFHGSRNGAAPTKLIQENFFQEQLVIVVRVVLWCSCTQTIWCPCQNCSKAFQYYQGWLKKAVLRQDVKYILKRDPLSAACGKCICQRQCYSHANMGLGSQEHLPEPYGCVGHRCRYRCRYIKLASAFFLSISVCAGWGHCFFFMYLFRLFGILSVVHSPGSFSPLVRIHKLSDCFVLLPLL